MNPPYSHFEKVEVDETIDIPNADGTGISQSITVKVPAWRDPKDGEIYLDADAIALLDKAKARHLGVLSPQELATMRRRFGLKQKELSELLQIGEKTWSRWENGRERPSRSLNLLLLALYEGKIDLAYLRNKQVSKKDPVPNPVFESFTQEQVMSGYYLWDYGVQIPIQSLEATQHNFLLLVQNIGWMQQTAMACQRASTPPMSSEKPASRQELPLVS